MPDNEIFAKNYLDALFVSAGSKSELDVTEIFSVRSDGLLNGRRLIKKGIRA